MITGKDAPTNIKYYYVEVKYGEGKVAHLGVMRGPIGVIEAGVKRILKNVTIRVREVRRDTPS